jgi:acetyl-CoA synthase
LGEKAAYQINPTGPNQPIMKGAIIDPVKGQWQGVNEFVYNNSHKTPEIFNDYGIIDFPMTSCGCFECIACVLPSTNGAMIVYREFPDMTPVGMKFSTLAGTVGGGAQTPGFIGHSKQYVGSEKFLLAGGGARRIVWMNSQLKEEMACVLARIAEEEVLEHISKMNHPAISMPPLF